MDLGLNGRVALVMGASKGIGRAIAATLAREGARVAISSRSEDTLRQTATEISGDVTPFAADTADTEGLAALPAEVGARLGPVEILVTNTGGPPLGGALDHELGDWDHAYRSLVLAPRVLAGTVVPGMRERGWGRIVNVGSSSTREPIAGLNLSNSHRMASVGFLKTLSREVAADGITVNTVATWRFATERLPGHARRRRGAPRAAPPPTASRPTPPRSRPPRRPPSAKSPPAASARRRSTATSSPSSAPS